MVRKSNRSTVVFLAALISLFSLAALVSGVVTHSGGIGHQARQETKGDIREGSVVTQSGKRVDAFKYLPAGAIINDPNKQIIFADLDGDGKKEITIFYATVNGEVHNANILVVKSSGPDYAPLWSDTYERSSGFADPTGVYDLNNSGKPQIVAYRVIGASCPGVLDIYEYRDNAIEKITGEWAGSCQSDLEIRDLDGDGVKEIIFRKLKYGVNRDIYRWNGEQYSLTTEQFAKHFAGDVNELIRNVHSRAPFPAPTRVNWCRQAIQILLLQRRYAEATSLCNATLRIISDQNLTVPNVVVKGGESNEQLDRIKMSFEVDKLKGMAEVNRLLGDTYAAAGDQKLSKQHYLAAQRLEGSAKEKAPALWH